MEAFDIRQLQPNHNVLVIGNRGSGKSTLIRDIIYNLKDEFGSCIGVNPTGDIPYMPAYCVYRDLDAHPTLASQLFSMHPKARNPTNMAVVLDNSLGYNSELIRDLFINGRVRKTFCIHSVGTLGCIPRHAQAHVDYVFVLPPHHGDRERRIVWESFIGADPPPSEAFKMYHALVLGPNKTVFGYTADNNIPPFKLL